MSSIFRYAVWFWPLVLLQCALAQVTVKVTPEPARVIPGEPVRISVRIANFSGQTLTLGEDDTWLEVNVETSDGKILFPTRDLGTRGAFELESSMAGTKMVNLSPAFRSIQVPGRYYVSCVVRIPQWKLELNSNRAAFNVIQPTVIWRQRFGVANSADSSGMPEVREYALLHVSNLDPMRLYLQISDPMNGYIRGVTELGPMLSFGRPEQQLDSESNIHILYQFGAHSFYYYIIDPGGNILQRHTYDYSSTRPILARTKSGIMYVAGGVRQLSINDIPAAKPAQFSAGPAATNAAPASTSTNAPSQGSPR